MKGSRAVPLAWTARVRICPFFFAQSVSVVVDAIPFPILHLTFTPTISSSQHRLTANPVRYSRLAREHRQHTISPLVPSLVSTTTLHDACKSLDDSQPHSLLTSSSIPPTSILIERPSVILQHVGSQPKRPAHEASQASRQ